MMALIGVLLLFLHFYICHFIAKLYFYFDSLYIEGRKETTIVKLKIIVISSVGFCFMLMLIFLPLSVNRIFNFFPNKEGYRDFLIICGMLSSGIAFLRQSLKTKKRNL